MKFLKKQGDHLVFQIGRREKDLLFELLKLYPLVPPAHHQISDAAESATKATQQLLDEALSEHRKENKQQVEQMLADPKRFAGTGTDGRLLLTEGELEWLLQVLNDVRVGSWLLLGGPDAKQGKRVRLSLKSARYLWAMDLAGHFQAALLSARDRT